MPEVDFLEQAQKSKNAEVSRRAKELIDAFFYS